MTTQTLQLNYLPRDQFIPFHNRHQRFALMVVHRRGGKTVAAVNDLVLKSLRTKKQNAKFAYVAPFYSQAKSIAWNYLKDATRDFALEIRESELSVKLPNQSTIRLFGADNPDALRGQYFDGIVLDEFADFRSQLYGEVILPCIADRQGWLLAIGTPKGKLNAFYTLYEKAKHSKDWFFKELKASESKLLPPSELQLMKEQMSEEQYDQEFEISFTAALKGTYYSTQVADAEREGRVDAKYDYDPNLPVYASADIGFTDSSVLWFFQQSPDGVRVFDCYENSGVPIQHYIDEIDRRPYKLETLYLPHDARAKTLQTGKSTIEIILESGQKCDIVPNIKVQHGIDAVRSTFPYLYFHTRCQHGLEALRVYRKKWDEQNKCFSNTPLHDFASDFADSARYMCLVANKKNPVVDIQATPTTIDTTRMGQYSLEDLFKGNEAKQSMRSKLRI
jgi:phage terminase large subunit